MDKKIAFQELIADFMRRPDRKVKARELAIPHDIPKIISLLGPRRAGKTYILFSLIEKLKKTIPTDRLVYINFEDDRLFPLKLEDMDRLIKGYYEMFPDNKDHTVYFFFDEIQEVDQWEKFIRRIHDQENCQIFITGSSSRLLSLELATSLRGRTLSFEVFPLSFSEFLSFRDVDYDIFSSKGQAVLSSELNKYVLQGGFPELIFLPEELHKEVINEYINLMLYRDLTERFSLKHPHLIKYLLKFLLTNMSRSVSVNKIYLDLKSQGYTVGKNTVYDYTSYLEEAFIIFRVDLFSHSIRRQTINPSKVYGIDPAFKYAMSFAGDKGQIFENTVFMELRRRKKLPFYLLEKQETDFYTEEGLLINACMDITHPETRKREINSLWESMNNRGLSESQLITNDKKEEIEIAGKKIWVRPLWEFLLDTEW
ncbi:MAG: ATP-binding protein [Bacteroidia bacterium]